MIEMLTSLSPEELASIEATHRGFLYQHLYLVGCMLLGFPARLQTAVSEHDEDIELEFESEYIYIQVKTRKSPPLQPSHLTTTKARFRALADEHGGGTRTRTPRFFLVTNSIPSEKLQGELLTAEWPPGTQVLHPGGTNEATGRMPPAWHDLQDALNWCVARAAELTSVTLDPTTLVLKLAGFSWLLSSGQFGAPRHCLDAESFTALLEQVRQSFHSLPASPKHYIPQKNEPPAQSTNKVRIVTGISGSGKTGWVSNAAAQSLGLSTYIDAASMFAGTIREEVVREACACLPIPRDQARLAMFAAKTSVAGLKVIDQELKLGHTNYTVFVDNAHAAEDADLLELTQAASSITWFFLCQPNANLEALSSRLGVRAEYLRGWDQAGIARYCKTVGFPITPGDSASLESLTGGVPLFVMNLVDLAQGGRQLAELLSEVRACISETLTLQEILVSRVLDAMTSDETMVAVLVLLAKVELLHKNWTELLANADLMNASRVMGALRSLRGKGVLSFEQDKPVSLHDAFIPAVSERAERIEAEIRRRFSLELYRVLMREDARWTHDVKDRRRLVRRVTLMPAAGLHDEYCTEIPVLAEMVLDQEEQQLLIQALQETIADVNLPPTSRFWTLQALAFLHMSIGTSDQARAYILSMNKLMPLVEPDDPSAPASSAHLNLQLQAIVGDEQTVRKTYGHGSRVRMDSGQRQIYDTTFAFRLIEFRRYKEAWTILEKVREHYMSTLGISVSTLMKNGQELVSAIHLAMPSGIDTASLKHLADVLRRQAVCERGLNHWPLYEMIHAAKLYALARYIPGEIALGFEIAEVALTNLGQPNLALDQCDRILVKARDAGWFEEIPAIQRMRIRAFIYLGQRELANATLEELEPYAVEGGELRAFIREARERLARPTQSYPLAQSHPPTTYGKLVLSNMLKVAPASRRPKWRR